MIRALERVGTVTLLLAVASPLLLFARTEQSSADPGSAYRYRAYTTGLTSSEDVDVLVRPSHSALSDTDANVTLDPPGTYTAPKEPGPGYVVDSAEFALDRGHQAIARQVTADDCRNRPGSWEEHGSVINHYNYCQAEQVTLEKTVDTSSGPQVVAHVSFRSTVVGTSSNSARRLTLAVTLDQFTSSGAWTDTQVQASQYCWEDPIGSCIEGPGHILQSISLWRFRPNATFEFTSAVETGTGPDHVARARFGVWWNIYDPETENFIQVVGRNSWIRFDSAPYLTAPGGAIFYNAIPWLRFSVSDPEVNEAAWHVFDAHVNPASTQPLLDGKTIPGRMEGPYIHRMFWDSAKIVQNQTVAETTCTTAGEYDHDTKRCDSYPYATTAEGAALGDNHYSARVIDSGDSVRMEQRLTAWYVADRVIDGDQFAINIVA